MKKLLISIVTLLALVSFDNASAQSKSEIRKENREKRQMEYMQKLASSIKEGQFTFTAQTFQGNIGNPINLNYPNNFLSFYGNFVDVDLPYYSFSALPSATAVNFTDGTAGYEVTFDGTYFYATITVKDAIAGPRNFITDNGNYTFHFTITAKTGYAILTLTPQLSTSAIYNGVIQSN